LLTAFLAAGRRGATYVLAVADTIKASSWQVIGIA
jgi:hypothetical protein